jgi:hypothetical protein
MLEWTSARDAALLGEDAMNCLAWCRVMDEAGLWEVGTLARWKTASGMAAWLWRGTHGLTCSAVAPWDDVHKADFVPAAVFYLASIPPGWKTKHGKGLPPRAAPRAKLYSVGGWCCGLVGRQEVVLARVSSLDEAGGLASVELSPDSGPMDVAGLPASKWWPVDKWTEGYRHLWQAGTVRHHNYRLACIRAALAHRRILGLPDPRKGRKAATR